MITKQDITAIISEAYTKASLADDCNMRLVADLLESVREQLDISEPYTLWESIVLDRIKFDTDYTLQVLLALKESYFILLFERLLNQLNTLFNSDKNEAFTLWYLIYADAAVHYRYDLICMLCYQRQQWQLKDTLTEKYSKLSAYIRENRWVDAFPLYEEIAANEELTDEVRGIAEITLLEIILYYYPEYSLALKHLEKSKILLPDHYLTKRAEAIFYLRTLEIQKARNGFIQLMSLKPSDYNSYNFMGDCFFAEAKYESAEYWYNEAIQKNLLQSESYSRKLFLYGDKSWFQEKESLLNPLLEKIEKRRAIGNMTSLIEKKLATKDCFNDLVLYDSYRAIGALYLSVQNYENSEKWYSKAIALQPQIALSLLDMAYVKQAQKLPDKDLEYFLKALEKDKYNFEVHWGLALYYQDHSQYEKALHHFNECLHLRPHWSDWVNNFIGNLYYFQKEYKESESYYRKSVETNDRYPIYRQNLAGSYEAQADQLNDDSELIKAEKLYLKAAAIDNSAERWNKVGNFYYNLKRWNEALDCYEKSISINNTNPVFYENCGLAYENLNKTTEAEQSYLKALEMDKESGHYFNRLGVFYFNQKTYIKSVNYYKEALEREPKQIVYIENICLSYEQMNQFDEAIHYYELALQINQNAKYFNAIGLIYFNRNQYQQAITNYRQAIKLDQNNGVFLTNLGLALVYSNQKEDAFDVFQKAVKLKDDFYLTWNDLGVLYYEKNDFDKAIECYQKSINLMSSDPVIYSNLALALNALGKEKDARDVIYHPLLNDEIREQVLILLQKNLPSLFN